MRRSPRFVGPTIFAPLADESSDSHRWFVQTSEPIRRRPQTPTGGITEPRVVTAFDASWFADQSLPVWRRRSAAEGRNVTASETLIEVAFNSWHVQATDPVRLRPRSVREGQQRNITEPTLFIVAPLDSWYVQHPVRPPARRLSTAAIACYVKPELPLSDALALCAGAATISVPWINEAAVSVGFVSAAGLRVPWVDDAQGGCR
jgi:hypothetical protein